MVVGGVEEGDVCTSGAMGKSKWAGFSLSMDTESVRLLMSSL